MTPTASPSDGALTPHPVHAEALVQAWIEGLRGEARTVVASRPALAGQAELLLAPLLGCSLTGIPDDFQERTRSPLAAFVRAWREAGLDEGSLGDAFGELADLVVARFVVPSPSSEEERARAAIVVMDCAQILVRRAERTFRSWRERVSAGAAVSAAIYAEVLATELRNRLHAAQTALDLLREGDLDPQRRLRLETLLLSAVHAAVGSADDIRYLSGENGPERPSPLDLGDLLRRTVRQLAPVAEHGGVTLRLLTVPDGVRVDARPTQVLLYNLITTAVGRAADGATNGPTLEIGAQASDAGTVELLLRSSAPIFETAGEPEIDIVDLLSTAGRHDDLSLWLTREAVDHLGGTMTVDRCPDGGDAVRIVFPSLDPGGEGDAAGTPGGRPGLSPPPLGGESGTPGNP